MLVSLYQAGYRCKFISNGHGKPVRKGGVSMLHEEIEKVIQVSSSGSGTAAEENLGWTMKKMVTTTFNLWWTKEV